MLSCWECSIYPFTFCYELVFKSMQRFCEVRCQICLFGGNIKLLNWLPFNFLVHAFTGTAYSTYTNGGMHSEAKLFFSEQFCYANESFVKCMISLTKAKGIWHTFVSRLLNIFLTFQNTLISISDLPATYIALMFNLLVHAASSAVNSTSGCMHRQVYMHK